MTLCVLRGKALQKHSEEADSLRIIQRLNQRTNDGQPPSKVKRFQQHEHIHDCLTPE
jgi:hypothetical protein